MRLENKYVQCGYIYILNEDLSHVLVNNDALVFAVSRL